MSTRPAIPQGSPPPYAIVTRIYKRSLRPVVMVCAVCAAIWTLLWGVSSFRGIENSREDGFPELVPFNIALGALFMAACLIEVFGILAATMQRLPLVRLYSFGTLLATLFILAAQVVIIVTDFLFKGKQSDTCTEANTGSLIVVSQGWWGRTRAESLSESEARKWCDSLIRREIVTDFAWLIVTTILALLFASVVFSYYRQLLDPAFSRAPSNQIRMQAFGTYPAPAGTPYGHPYGASGYGQQDYVPPYDPSKLPGYTGDGRQTPEKEDEQKTTFAPPSGPPPGTFAPPPGPPPQAANATNPF